jgi:hypothetical protein
MYARSSLKQIWHNDHLRQPFDETMHSNHPLKP